MRIATRVHSIDVHALHTWYSCYCIHHHIVLGSIPWGMPFKGIPMMGVYIPLVHLFRPLHTPVDTWYVMVCITWIPVKADSLRNPLNVMCMYTRKAKCTFNRLCIHCINTRSTGYTP